MRVQHARRPSFYVQMMHFSHNETTKSKGANQIGKECSLPTKVSLTLTLSSNTQRPKRRRDITRAQQATLSRGFVTARRPRLRGGSHIYGRLEALRPGHPETTLAAAARGAACTVRSPEDDRISTLVQPRIPLAKSVCGVTPVAEIPITKLPESCSPNRATERDSHVKFSQKADSHTDREGSRTYKHTRSLAGMRSGGGPCTCQGHSEAQAALLHG